MIKVELRENFRYFSDHDTDFSISAGTPKMLRDQDQKAYQIKQYLWQGHLKVVEGEVLLFIKGMSCYISAGYPGKGYVKEHDEAYFERNLDLDELVHVKPESLPVGVKAILDNRELPIESAAIEPEPIEPEPIEPEVVESAAIEPEPIEPEPIEDEITPKEIEDEITPESPEISEEDSEVEEAEEDSEVEEAEKETA